MVNTPRAAMQAVQQKLAEAGLDSVQFESRILLETVLELPCGAPLPQQPLTGAQQQRLAELTARRCAHEPLQYLCGTWEFFGLEFLVGEGVLIPRQDTETLVEAVLELRKNEPSTCLLDLCSGSGCIPSALSVHLSGVTGAVLELSPEAMGYLRQNLKRHAPQLECIAGDVLHPPAELLHRQFHIITCNPPYLTAADMEQLQPEVAREPETALFGGTDGLDFYRKLTPLWKPALQPAGWLVYEVGAGQAPDVDAILQKNGYAQVHTVPDLTGIGRVVLGQR